MARDKKTRKCIVELKFNKKNREALATELSQIRKKLLPRIEELDRWRRESMNSKIIIY